MRVVFRMGVSAAVLTLAPGSRAVPMRHFPPTYVMRMPSLEAPPDPQVERRYTASFEACQKQARFTSENAACFDREFVRQDMRLNSIWKATVGRVSPSARRALVDAERTWIGRRDPFCRSYSDGFSGGTFEPLAYSSCRVEQTVRRSLWVEDLQL